MNKKKIIASAVLTTCLCTSLIAGTTYALFTSESEVNVAITSGKVDVVAHADNIQLSSALGGNLSQTSATFAENTVTLDKIVPGDKVTFDIVIENRSNITVLYQTVISVVEGVDLYSGLNISLGEVQFDGITAYGQWTKLSPDETEVATVPVSIELPEDAGNEYMDKTCTISYKVNAVQGNAHVEDVNSEDICLYTATDLQLFAASVNNGNNYKDKTVRLMNDVDLSGIEWTPIGILSNSFSGTFEGGNHTISNMHAVSKIKGSAAAGFFGTFLGTVKDMTFTDAKVESTHYAGVVVGYSTANVGMRIENCHVDGATVTSVPEWLGVKNSDGYEYDNGDKVGGIIGYCVSGDTVTGNTVRNITLRGYRDIGSIVGSGLGNGNNITDNTAENVTVIADQKTGFYGEKAVNAGDIVGRADYEVSDTNKINGITYEFIGCVNNRTMNLSNLKNNALTIKDIESYATGISVSGAGTLTLDNVAIAAREEGVSALTLAADTNLTLVIRNTCVLKGAKKGDGITVPESATLNLSGDTLTAIGNNGYEYADSYYQNTEDTSYLGSVGSGIRIDGTATVNGVENLTAEGYGAHAVGIGGATNAVVIANTTIAHARGGFAKELPNTDMKYAKEGEGGPAIGTLNEGTVTLTDVTVNAAEGGAKCAAIGGFYHQPVTVNISGCTLNNIVGGHSAAAIGGGRATDTVYTVRVIIDDSTVSARGGYYGAGIGSGYDTHCSGAVTCHIEIKGTSKIAAVGGNYAAGIGTGYHVGHLTGYIDSTVDTTGTAANEVAFYKNAYTTAQAIGYGVTDPAREIKEEEVTFRIGDTVIADPRESVNTSSGS